MRGLEIGRITDPAEPNTANYEKLVFTARVRIAITEPRILAIEYASVLNEARVLEIAQGLRKQSAFWSGISPGSSALDCRLFRFDRNYGVETTRFGAETTRAQVQTILVRNNTNDMDSRPGVWMWNDPLSSLDEEPPGLHIFDGFYSERMATIG
jgi:hypothetical protein